MYFDILLCNMAELVTNFSDTSIGILEDDTYRPIMMWNIAVKSYIRVITRTDFLSWILI